MKLKLQLLIMVCSVKWNALAQPTQQYCQHFDGNQVISALDNTTLEITGNFTFEAYIYLETASPYAIIAGKTFDPRSDNPYQNYVLSLDASGVRPEIVQTTGQNGSYTTATSPTDLALNTWTHVAGILDNGQLKLVINGTLVSSQTSPGAQKTNTNVPFGIGSGMTPTHYTTCCGFKGNMMQVRIWNLARTEQELVQYKDSLLQGTENGLLAYYPMNEANGQVINDISPNNNNLVRGTTNNAESTDPTVFDLSYSGPFFELETYMLPTENANCEDLLIVDINTDEQADLMITRLKWPPTNPATYTPIQTMMNQGNFQFQLQDVIEGFDSLVHPRDYATGDFNGDGFEDLFIADHGTDVNPFPGGQNRLYLNNGSGKLIESSAGRIPSILDFSHNTTAGDIDNDGDLDIYVCNIYNQASIGPRLLINDGSATFTVNTSKLPTELVNLNKVYMSSRFSDIDKDGDLDLILGGIDNGGLTQDGLLLNNGSGKFTWSPTPLPNRHGNANWGTVSIVATDINNDSYEDLIMSTLYQYQTCFVQVLVNNRNGSFSDSSQNLQQQWPSSNTWIKWIEAADLNEDGWKDLVITSHYGQPKIYYNRGNTKFSENTSIITAPNQTISCRLRDYNGDSLIDLLFLKYDGTLSLFRNLKPFPVEIDSSGLVSTLSTNPTLLYDDLQYFPNPVNDKLTIYSGKKTDGFHIKLYSIYGEKLIEAISTSNELTLSVQDLPIGVYVVQVYSTDNNVAPTSLRIFKE